MPRSTVIIVIVAIVAFVIIIGFAAKVNIARMDAEGILKQQHLDGVAQADRDYHVSIAVRAQQYTLRSYSVELDDSTRTAAFIESQQWIDSLKAGE